MKLKFIATALAIAITCGCASNSQRPAPEGTALLATASAIASGRPMTPSEIDKVMTESPSTYNYDQNMLSGTPSPEQIRSQVREAVELLKGKKKPNLNNPFSQYFSEARFHFQYPDKAGNTYLVGGMEGIEDTIVFTENGDLARIEARDMREKPVPTAVCATAMPITATLEDVFAAMRQVGDTLYYHKDVTKDDPSSKLGCMYLAG
jgi:hypothetical protein